MNESCATSNYVKAYPGLDKIMFWEYISNCSGLETDFCFVSFPKEEFTNERTNSQC